MLQAIGETTVATAAAAAEAVSALKRDSETTLRLSRSGKPRTAVATAALAYEVAALAHADTSNPALKISCLGFGLGRC